MQRDFNNRDFEQFVKQNADQYRMFPSEKVWQGINGALHTRRKWYGLGLVLLLLLTGTAVTLVMVSTPGNKQMAQTTAPSATTPSNATGNATSDIVTGNNGGIITPSPANPLSNNLIVSHQQSDIPAAPPTAASERATESPFASTAIAGTSETPFVVNVQNSVAQQKVSNTVSTNTETSTGIIVNHALPVSPVTSAEVITATTTDQQKQSASSTTTSSTQADIYPLTIESVVNSYQPRANRKKFSMQFYMTPTISYRKLSENKKFLQSAADNGMIPVYAAYSDINNYVSHKPDMGLEMGLTGKYALSDNFKLRAGVQFNVSRYDIKAAYEQRREDATIALDGGTFGGNQTIIRQTNYRNFNGNNPMNWLKNLYYSVSLPLGAEITFNSRSNAHFGIAATFQPTYIIKDRAYLISTDYKNYVEVPSLVRKFNMNSSFETFVAYSTRNINWQIGPQIRYQLQSSFTKRYPFKENLFDFGLKVGIQLNR